MFCEALDQLETWWGNLRQRNIAMPPIPAGNDTEDEANDSQVPSTQLAEHANVPVVTHASFRLPQAMVKNALDQIDRAIPFGDPMDLIERPDPTEPRWIAEIENVGEFTHRQLIAMHYIRALITAWDSGMKCYSWLMGTIDERFEGEGAASLENRLINSWPGVYDHVGRLIQEQYYHILPPLKTPADRKGDRISLTTISLLSAATVPLVFMPMNINSSHWMCLVVGRKHKTIACYDSLDKRSNHNLLAEVASELVTKRLGRLSILQVHSPIQKDSDNCGMFVCFYFWRRVFKECGNDYSEMGLTRRRWDILRMVVNVRDSCGSTNKMPMKPEPC
ncbi:unnamed protein product [Phytophthora fragariaefolia]|uniref:Unnamed protein product n=1 Tax=Phytophthora fragariaefolia TaxID=1490495 RepID=A0A9W6Y1W4_9STRA|nr:unnamed protein product [Phytophthora fragariaefolia]